MLLTSQTVGHILIKFSNICWDLQVKIIIVMPSEIASILSDT